MATDEMGRPRLDADGEAIPRPTTIYDAVTQRYRMDDGEAEGAEAAPEDDGAPEGGSTKRAPGRAKNPIPILCHTMYMDPVAVCRVCVVQLARFSAARGRSRSSTS